MTTVVIDPDVFGELREAAGADFVGELIDTFAEEAPGMFAALRAARATDDGDGFRRAAHSLKSNANTFGAIGLGARARELELAGLAADTVSDDAAIIALEAAYDEAIVALRVLRDG
jgi:HPt (histidine-containing phosphotransfer) domain-containing protein